MTQPIATIDPAVLRMSRTIARDAMDAGAQAVVLAGSHANGSANQHSDVDLLIVGKGPGYTLSRRGRFLVSTEWRTPAACRASLRTPSAVGAAVPGWRQAIIIEDPHGTAAAIQRRAHAFTWDAITEACDRWVADQITGYAEEVHKLVAAVESGSTHAAAAWRSILALRLAPIMAVHRRILYGTENVLWDLVSQSMGDPWASAQSRALCERRETQEASCRAALDLYTFAATECWPLLNRSQRRVVRHAATIAGYSLTH
ncbi:MAG TPA: nucleotidyltransferase domain-containing protein [Dehalococcoidia bacterium]|nr:nucleotidyltransferase domain-containing protein [Dehalococcoidia bacterium]